MYWINQAFLSVTHQEDLYVLDMKELLGEGGRSCLGNKGIKVLLAEILRLSFRV